MTHQEAMAKALKLLRLSQSNNPHEATLAAGRAQEIIDRFKLGALSLDYDTEESNEPDEEIKDFGFDPLENSVKAATWKVRLSVAIAKANGCQVYRSGGRIALIGRPSDVQTVRCFYAWLRHVTERLALRHCKGCGMTYANNFRLGVVDTIHEKLRASQKETVAAVKHEAEQSGNPMALVRVEKALAKKDQALASVEEWTRENKKLYAGRCASYRPDLNARYLGQCAGQSINIRPTRASLTGAC